MRSVQHIGVLLLCALLVCLCACNTQLPGGETQAAQPASTRSESMDEPSASALPIRPDLSTEPETRVAAVAVRPTQEDLDTLCDILRGEAFFSADYDCRTDNVLDYLYNNGLLFELLNMERLGLLTEGKNLFRSEAYPDVGRVSGTDDPLGCFQDRCYIRVQADVLNAYMENTFCNTVYRSHTEYRDSDGNVGYYLHDGWYYFSWEISGMEGVAIRAADCSPQDGHWRVTIHEYTSEPGEEDEEELIVTLAVDAALQTENGAHAWSIYRVENVYHKY